MAIAYLKNPLTGAILRIQNASQLQSTLTATPSTNPVASLEQKADHLVVNPETFTVEGVASILGTDGREDLLSPIDFDEAIKNIIKSRIPFKFYLDDSSRRVVPEFCVITSYSTTSNVTNEAGFSVQIELSELPIAKRATSITVNYTPRSADKDAVASTKNVGDTSEELDAEETQVKFSFLSEMILSDKTLEDYKISEGL